MLEEEEKFQISIERTFILLQTSNWILLCLSCGVTIGLLLTLKFNGSFLSFLTLMIGMGLFVALFCYSMFYVKNSLRNLCFHLALVVIFFLLQVTVYLMLIINPSLFQRLFTSDAYSLFQTYNTSPILFLAATFVATVKWRITE